MKLMINVRLEENVVVTEGFTQEHLSKIQAVSEDFDIVVPQTAEETQAEILDTDIVFGDFSRAMFAEARNLRWVQSIGSGIDGVLFDDFVESDIILTSAKGTVGTHLADHAWALILALTRGIHTALREKTWSVRMPIRARSWELAGMTLGVFGLGGTGVEVARRAQGFGMRTLALDSEEVSKPSFVEEVWPLDRFYDLLEESDIVVICLPLTPETRGVFNAKAFSHMRNHALLINVTRGDIVDGPSLLEALEKGAIGGAGLDTSPGEPLPDDHPLWNMENVVVTPHTAGGSPVRVARIVDVFCDNLKRYLEGRPLTGVIDKHKGY